MRRPAFSSVCYIIISVASKVNTYADEDSRRGMIYVIFKADGATVARHYVQRVKSEIDANFYGSNGSYFAK